MSLQSAPFLLTKMSGAGNTFTLIDATRGSAWLESEKTIGRSRADFAKLICDRVLGLATDGCLWIEDGPEGFHFQWDFYNSDGSTAEMCGNAARCAARFCAETMKLHDVKAIHFKTGAGLVTAQVLDNGRIRVKMPKAVLVKKELLLMTKSSSSEKFVLVNTGVPHLVQKIHSLSDATQLKEMAREARSHEDLKPSGANVTFYAEDQASGRINAVTFERGVEDYTLACGTGAVAAAMVYNIEHAVSNVQVQMPGGLMDVFFAPDDAHPLMTGDAVFIGDFKYNIEVLK